jgi:DNA-binding MarR family transcriptional regulator
MAVRSKSILEVVNYSDSPVISGPEPMTAGGKGGACETWRLLFDPLLSHRAHLPSVAAEFDLSEMQGHVLRLVEPAGGVSMGRLARSLACDASNVTGIVDRLEARGLLVRQPDEADRRLKVIALTPRGAAIRGSRARTSGASATSCAGPSRRRRRVTRRPDHASPPRPDDARTARAAAHSAVLGATPPITRPGGASRIPPSGRR